MKTLNPVRVFCGRQEDVKDQAVHYSGNPGYLVGLPLVSGTRTAEYPSRCASLRPVCDGMGGLSLG